MRCVVVPEKVRGRARSMGQKGLQWLDSLDLTTLPLSDKLRMILTALEQVWRLPCPTEHAFVTGEVSVRWFRAYLLDMWAKLAYPCPF